MRAIALTFLCLACDGPGAPADAGSRPDVQCPDAGSVDPMIDFFVYLADPYAPARTLPGCMELASSRVAEGPDGNANADHNVYLGREGNESLLIDDVGPGVVTRIWFTLRSQDGTQDIADTTVMHLYIDGSEIALGSDARGVTLLELGSGTLPGLPRPWVAGRDTASGAIQCLVPMHYQESLRITIEEPSPDTLLYYQIDHRRLPEGSLVRSFDGVPTEPELVWLDRATALWVDNELDAEMRSTISATVAAGDDIMLAIDDPTIVRRLSVESASLDALSGVLSIDGETVIDAPLRSWMFAAAPAEPYASALSAVSADALALMYPGPAREGVVWTVRNTSAAPVEVALAIEHDPGAPASDLGSLRIECGHPAATEVGTNVRLLEINGARGHYAGQSLVSHGAMFGFTVLEGDHELVADGEYVILGTGVEDYFGGSFYYVGGPFTLPFTGASGIERLAAGATIAFQYRHHVIDTIPFENSFAFEYEAFEVGGSFEHCSYWYEMP